MPGLETYDAIMLLSYGGPNGEEDVLPFMRNATRGRGIPDERLLQVAAHYKRFGGVSPINACNQRLIADLSAELARRGRCMIAMPAWSLRCCPPDRCEARWPRFSVRPRSSMTSLAREADSRRVSPFSSPKAARFWATLRSG